MKDISIVNLNSYTTPKVIEYRNKDWISYGEGNDYFQHLIDRYNGSPTNNAIINGLSDMIYGDGLDSTDSSRKPEEYAKALSLFTKDCVRKLVYDLKLMGQCSMQLIYSKDRKTIAKVEHFPIETLRAEKSNDDGEIEAYYYHPDWSKVKPNDKPKRIPAFGFSEENIEVLVVKPYRAGYYYFSPVDYQGGLQYSELEEEIANYHLNNIQNGLAPSMLINFNNGVPSDEEREMIEQRIYKKYSGTSNSGKFILAFNDSADQAANLQTVELSEAHAQYEFLSNEASRKILVSHRIVSPMLFGIKDQTGLGNNADELKTASILTDNVVVRPFQRLLIDSFDQILAFNGIALNLYFKTLQPLEFVDVDNIQDKDTREEETGVKENLTALSLYEAEDWLEHLKDVGEDDFDEEEYELIDSEIVDDEEPEDFDVEEYLNGIQLSANQKSEIDDKFYKVRYKYVKGTKRSPKSDSRLFCSKMLRMGKLYRKEDIIRMEKNGVNKSHGHKGEAYSIFKYKGGVNCHHRWERRIYKKRKKIDGSPYGGSPLTGTRFVNVNQAVREGFKLPKQPTEVSVAPVDMPRNGHHPNWKP